jgi:hypothetical protein
MTPSRDGGVALLVTDNSASASTNGRSRWWFVGAIQLFLLAEGVGWWAVLIIIAVAYGSLALYYGGIFAVFLLLGPALLVGIPAVVIALRPRVLDRGQRTPGFLALNTLGAILAGALAFSQPDPVWYYALIAAATAGATLLLFVAGIRIPARIAASAIAALALLCVYAATYALPATTPPAPALHFRGVLILPPSAGTVTPNPAGQGFEQADGWTAATVSPGTYRYAQACNGDWDHPTWATVQVGWGAVVRARDQCPAPGGVRGYASWLPCLNVRGRDCQSRPFAQQRIAFQDTSWGGVFEATTDDSGNYTILLPPGRFVVGNESGYVLASAPLEVTVESGVAKDLDVTFRPSP